MLDNHLGTTINRYFLFAYFKKQINPSRARSPHVDKTEKKMQPGGINLKYNKNRGQYTLSTRPQEHKSGISRGDNFNSGYVPVAGELLKMIAEDGGRFISRAAAAAGIIVSEWCRSAVGRSCIFYGHQSMSAADLAAGDLYESLGNPCFR